MSRLPTSWTGNGAPWRSVWMASHCVFDLRRKLHTLLSVSFSLRFSLCVSEVGLLTCWRTCFRTWNMLHFFFSLPSYCHLDMLAFYLFDETKCQQLLERAIWIDANLAPFSPHPENSPCFQFNTSFILLTSWKETCPRDFRWGSPTEIFRTDCAESSEQSRC